MISDTLCRARLCGRRQMLLQMTVAAGTVLLAACGGETLPPPVRHVLKGKIVSIDTNTRQLTVDHEEIPGFMSAMTMAYPVKEEQALSGLSPGDEVTADVVSEASGAYWLENIVAKADAMP